MRTGIIGDTHFPFTHPKYLEFCQDMFETWDCDTFVHIGDEVDNHAISFHETDPDGFSGGDEAEEAQTMMDKCYELWPEVKVCVGNHSALPYRKAMAAGLPKRFMKTYEDIWYAPEGWEWAIEHEIDGVIYTHGTGNSGMNAHRKLAVAHQQSTVIGHVHSHAGISTIACQRRLCFGMNVGCGIDLNSYAAAYGKHFPYKPILSCGIVIDGVEPHLEIMNLDKYK